MSDSKLWVVDTFQKGMNLANVAHELCDQTATVEVDQLESLVTGKCADHHQQGSALYVTEDDSVYSKKEKKKKNWLMEVNESFPGFSFYQICDRFVLAILNPRL